MKILMVCLGNICRSPLAEGILKNKTKYLNNIKIDSAGTAGYHIGKKPDLRSIKIAAEYNIDISNQKARQFTQEDFNNFDVIYVMDTSNYSHLTALARNNIERKKIKLILNEIYPKSWKSVPDPYYGGKFGFKEVYNLLDKACKKIVTQID